MFRTSLARISLSIPLLLVGSFATAEPGWQQVHPLSSFVDRDGTLRHTGCSNAPFSPSADFSFFFREGNPRRLVIGFDGGGACWDSLTCVGSVLNEDPVYETVVDETTARLDGLGGLFDRDNPEKPLSDALQVLIPYCTGDLHMGSNDQVYILDDVPYTIRHRGYDNVVAVLEWLTDYYANTAGARPKQVFVTGASAGGYGAQFAYPEIDSRLPAAAHKRVLSDSAIGVINADFYNRALAPGGVWGIWINMPPELAGAFATSPETLPIAINQSLGWNFPRTRFGQYTHAFDAVQVLYYNIARHLDEPEFWTDPTRLLLTALEWTTRTRAILLASAMTTANYRYYLGAGFDHTIIASDDVYFEDSADDLRFIDWLDHMINQQSTFGGDWQNASCSPNCLP